MRVEYESQGYYALERANPTDTGLDLKALEDVSFRYGDCKVVSTGMKIKVDKEDYLPVLNFKKTLKIPDVKLAWMENVTATQAETNFGLDIQVRGRSSMAVKGFITHVGTVDDTYHSPISVMLTYHPSDPRTPAQRLLNLLSLDAWFKAPTYTLNKGDKIAQLVFSPFLPVELFAVVNIEEDRQGLGSSGV